jgi:hypothetical protein
MRRTLLALGALLLVPCPTLAQTPLAFQLDHMWLAVSPGAPERKLLERAGLVVAPGVNRFDGQGTASVTIEFTNTFLELMWLDSSVAVEPGREAYTRRFRQRVDWRVTGAAPIGLQLRRSPGAPDSLPFETWSLHMGWMPSGVAYGIITPRTDTLTPTFSVIPRGHETPEVRDPPAPGIEAVRLQALKQPTTMRRVTDARLVVPRSYHPTDAMRIFQGLGAVPVEPGDAWRLELTLNDGATHSTLDCRPGLPLVIHY